MHLLLLIPRGKLWFMLFKCYFSDICSEQLDDVNLSAVFHYHYFTYISVVLKIYCSEPYDGLFYDSNIGP